MFRDFVQSKNVRYCLFIGIAMTISPLLTSQTKQAIQRAFFGLSMGIGSAAIVYLVENKKKT